MTVDNVTHIMNKIEGNKWKVMRRREIVSRSQLEKIQERYTADTEKIHACAEYYVKCHPDASWQHLTQKLYFENEFATARESKSIMSTGNTNILVQLLRSFN